MVDETGQPDIAVTLVHGTFARNARWTRSDSTFVHRLKDRLGGARVEFHAFQWSGRNSPSSRSEAAHELRAYLRKNLESSPEAAHYIVAHSHGGAVALKALELDPELQRRIKGVTSLATPYIDLRERDIAGSGYGATVTRLWLVPLVAVIGVAVGAAVARVFWQIPNYIPAWSLWVAVVGIGSIIAAVTHRVAGRLAKITDRFAASVRSSLENTIPAKFNLLVIRMSGDEAAALLAVSQLLAWVIRRLWGVTSMLMTPVFRAIDRLERKARWLPGLMVFFIAFLIPIIIEVRQFQMDMGAFLGALTQSGPLESTLIGELWESLIAPFKDPSLESVLVALFAVVVLLVFVAAVGTLVLWPVLILLGIALLPFGAEAVMTTLLMEVSAEPVPRGSWTVHQYSPPIDLQQGVFSLAHSVPYDDPRIIQLIGSWMLGELE